MIKIKDLNKTKLIISGMLTALVIGALFVTLLASVDFDFSKINWFDFAYSIMNWVMGRTIYFPVGTDLGEQNAEVKKLEATINKYRDCIFKKRVTKEISNKIDLYNKIAKMDAYIAYLDTKLSRCKGNKAIKFIEKKTEALDYLKSIQNPSIEYNGNFNIDTIKVDFDKIDMGTCFSFGIASRNKGTKYKINLNSEGIKKAIPSFTWTIVISLVNASLTFNSYGFSYQSLFTFFIKLVLFILGCYMGITLGKSIVEEDKYQVLLNICAKLKEVITDVEKDLNIKIDE